MKLQHLAVAAMLAAACSLGTAQTASAKKELVAKVLLLTQPSVEQVARGLAEQPAAQMLQAAARAVVTQVPADRRDAVAAAIKADVKKYMDETTPLLRERAVKLLPSTLGAALEEKFSEDELKALVAWHESPLNRKYQQLAPEMQNEFMQKLVADSRATVEPRLKALEATISGHLGIPARPASPAPAASGPRK